MGNLNNIFGKPHYVEGVGNIYPIKIKDYDEFIENADVLYYSKKHFGIENDNISLFYMLFIFGMQNPNIIKKLQNLFSMILKKDTFVAVSDEFYGFIIDEDHSINEYNYDLVRQIVMNQNIVYEPKVYKNPLVQQWAEKALEAKAKNSIKMTIEDMITTVHVFTGIEYEKLADYTYYQLQASFNRIKKFKNYDSSIAMKCAGAEKVDIEHFAEELELYKNPYDDLFVGKGKLEKLNNALKS